MKYIALHVSVVLLLLVGCSQEQSSVKEIQKESDAVQLEAIMQKKLHKAVVLEVIDTQGYTYAKVKEDGKVYFIAGPTTKLNKGDTLTIDKFGWFENFPSQALDRTFERIMFVDSFSSTVEQAANEKIENIHKNEAQKSPAIKEVETVKPIKGDKTIAEIYKHAKSLNGTTISVSGTVVKTTHGVMNRTFVHIMDGSSTTKTGDLLVTTEDHNVTQADTVRVTGTIQTDVDFGLGYAYDVILKDATIKPYSQGEQ